MEAIRKMFPDAQDSITVDLPPSFRHRLIEVVVIPLDAEFSNSGHGEASAWPAGFFERIAGGWSGEPLVRAPQGIAYLRASLD